MKNTQSKKETVEVILKPNIYVYQGIIDEMVMLVAVFVNLNEAMEYTASHDYHLDDLVFIVDDND